MDHFDFLEKVVENTTHVSAIDSSSNIIFRKVVKGPYALSYDVKILAVTNFRYL